MAELDTIRLRILHLAGDNFAEFARTLGIADKVQRLYDLRRRENEPSMELVAAVLEAHPEISPRWLVEGQGEMLRPPPVSEFVSIKKLDGKIAGGAGGVATVAGDFKYLALRSDWVRPKVKSDLADLFAVEVTGDSMEPFFSNGDLAFIDPSKEIPRENYVYAIDGPRGPVIKELRFSKDSQDRDQVEVWERFPAEKCIERILLSDSQLNARIQGRVFLISREIERLQADEDSFQIVARKLGADKAREILDRLFPPPRDPAPSDGHDRTVTPLGRRKIS